MKGILASALNRASAVAVAVTLSSSALLVTAVPAGASTTASPPRAACCAEAQLQEALEADVAANPSVPGEALAVRAPGLRADVATGLADIDAGTSLEPDTPFRVASMTKTFVAAAVLRLVEKGRLALHDPIADYLSRESLDVLRADGYDPDRITVKQLLQHTSGLFDYADTDEYSTATAANPTHRWTRLEQLQLATELGDPIGEPGTVFGYSDTGYVLLGEILERVTGDTLPGAVRELLHFDRLGLDDTYWESLEPAPEGAAPRAHQYFDTYDNIALDASTDLYGGGGLVSTVDDLARFYRALFHGKVFDRPKTLRTMTTVSGPGRDEGAAMGIYDVDAAGERCYGHAGFWGTQTIHCPDLDLTFARTHNQALDEDFDYDALEQVIVDLAREAQPARGSSTVP
jgi:D-alanyl-D-alanine carboxypeptidase